MRLNYSLAIIACAVATAVSTAVKRAPPLYDVYIYADEDCEGLVGQICEGIRAGSCCGLVANTDLATSALYTKPGRATPSTEYEIGAYTRMWEASENRWERCGLQTTRDEKCASGLYLSISGAMVLAGSDTPTKRSVGGSAVRAGSYFLL